MMTYLFLFFVCFMFDCSKSKEIYICDNCDVVLGGLAPIHDSIEGHGRNVRCGNSFREHAMPRVEAMLFAIDKINNDSKILKNIKLGIRILDTCGIPSIGTDSAKKFIDLRCKESTKASYVAGVVGPMYSTVTIDVAKFLTPWSIPLVSPAATSVKLGNVFDYSMFARTVPSDTYQNRVVVDILKHLGWTLVSTIVSEEFSGEGLKEFRKRASDKQICNFREFELSGRNHKQGQENMRFVEIMCEILLHTDSNVIVLLTNDQDTTELLKAKQRVQSSSGIFSILYNIFRITTGKIYQS